MSIDLNSVKYVTIGQGRSVHVAHVFTYRSGEQYLAAKCDQSGFANITSGRKVRAVDADAATCKRCIKIAGDEQPVVEQPVVEQPAVDNDDELASEQPVESTAMKGRLVRVDDELWDDFKRVAAERGDIPSELLRAAMRRYVKRHDES